MQFVSHPQTAVDPALRRTHTAVPSRPGFFARPAVLWTCQGALAALFVFAGGFKLVTPPAEMAEQSGLNGYFLLFIGACELLGGLGLLLPGILRIRTGLTPLAAAGLVVIMVGAVVVTALDAGIAPAVMPLFVGVLAGYVAYERWQS